MTNDDAISIPWYTSARHHELERDRIFVGSQFPQYLGSSFGLRAAGDYCVSRGDVESYAEQIDRPFLRDQRVAFR